LYRPLKEHSTGRGDPGGTTRACRSEESDLCVLGMTYVCRGAALRAQAPGWSGGVRGARWRVQGADLLREDARFPGRDVQHVCVVLRVPRDKERAWEQRGARRVRLVRGEGRGVST